MADETVIAGPSIDTAQNIPIGAETKPGETTGRLRVFDTGVDSFPSTEGLGFHALTVDAATSVAQSMTQLLAKATASGSPFPQNFKAKRSITLLADGSNTIPVYVGDINTAAHATGGNAVGFPLKADASITLEITDPSKIYLDATASGPVIYWIAV